MRLADMAAVRAGRLILLGFLIASAILGPRALASSASGPPQLPAVMVSSPPMIDGDLSDPCWREASHVSGFWREQVDAPELEPTEAWICYDRRAIYVAFRCHDSRPELIRADQRKRQGAMGRDDRVQVCLDVEDAGRNSYRFRVNPAGTQSDSVPGGTSEKIEWKGDWRAAARTDEAGWSAEFEIPFSILRYPDGQSCFRVEFERRLARAEDDSIWPPGYARRQDQDEWARWTGVQTPPAPFRHVIMPYLLTVVSESEEDRELLTGGLDVKGTLPNGVVGLATYRPDFRNLEDVVETLDFAFVERYLPEYRPFFQEGAGYGPPEADEWGGTSVFYSRRIGELDWGAKAFGTVGAHRFGLLEASRGGAENHFVWNIERLFGTRGSIGCYGADRRVEGEPDNLAYGIGSHWHLPFAGGSRSYSIEWAQSRTEGEGGDDGALHLGAGLWRRQGIGWWADYRVVQPGFRADDGYVPETGVRGLGVGVSHSSRYDQGPYLEVESWASADVGESGEGSRRGGWLSHHRVWRTGWSLGADISRGVRDGYDVMSQGLGVGWNRQDIYRQGGLRVAWGERYAEPYRYYRISQGLRLAERARVEISAERSHAPSWDDDGNRLPAAWSEQLVVTASYDLSEERTVSARLVHLGSTTNAYAAYRQRVRRGADLLIVVGDPNAEEWRSRIAAKVMWCL